MKTRVGPIANAPYPTVFHRIEVDVIDVRPEVVHVPDSMFPIPWLPEIVGATSAEFSDSTTFSQMPAEPGFDGLPPAGEVAVVFGQGEDGMDVVRQDDDGIYCKRAFMTDLAECHAKAANVVD